jgi:OOP family OmpA-OmpF porin
MRNSERTRSSNRLRRVGAACFATLTAAFAWSTGARAQQQRTPQPAEGFGVERLYLSAPGAGWFVMDSLDMRGGLGGVAGLTLGYAHDPLRIKSSDGSQHLAVVSDEAFANVGFAATYDRWRLYLNFNAPLVIEGQSGPVGNHQFAAPAVDPGSNPDTLSDARIGFEGRLVGDAASPFRFGVDAQLFVPNGERADYDTDGSYRAMARVLFAGDSALLSYAGHLGAHVRPLDDSPTPGSPRGSELLFGVAGGARVFVSKSRDAALIVGPEFFGTTAFQSLGSSGTAFEGMLSARLEGTRDDEAQLRLKLGFGVGIDPRFGAPEWRAAVAIELFDHHADRYMDGIPNGHDACPDTPGIRTKDPWANGCPPHHDGDGIPGQDESCPDKPGPAAPNLRINGCPGPDKNNP